MNKAAWKREAKRLFDRIPRMAWQVGLYYGHEIAWGYIVFRYSDVQAEIDEDPDTIVVTRRVWISPAKLATKPEFEGW